MDPCKGDCCTCIIPKQTPHSPDRKSITLAEDMHIDGSPINISKKPRFFRHMAIKRRFDGEVDIDEPPHKKPSKLSLKRHIDDDIGPDSKRSRLDDGFPWILSDDAWRYVVNKTKKRVGTLGVEEFLPELRKTVDFYMDLVQTIEGSSIYDIIQKNSRRFEKDGQSIGESKDTAYMSVKHYLMKYM